MFYCSCDLGFTELFLHSSSVHIQGISIPLLAAVRQIGLRISVSPWPSYAQCILHYWQPICTASDVGTPTLDHPVNGAKETAEHLVLHYSVHDQARRESWPNLNYQSDPKRGPVELSDTEKCLRFLDQTARRSTSKITLKQHFDGGSIQNSTSGV